MKVVVKHADVLAAQAGDKAARDRVVAACMPKVARAVRRQRRPDLADDMTQSGVLGVLTALRNYDPTHIGENGERVRFSNYVGWWILDALQVERRKSDSDGFTGGNLHRQIKALRGSKSGARTESEHARLVGQPANIGTRYKRNEHAWLKSCSDYGTGGEAAMLRDIDASRLRELVERLPQKTRQVIELRYLQGKTWNEIEGLTGIRRKRAQALKAAGLEALKGGLT